MGIKETRAEQTACVQPVDLHAFTKLWVLFTFIHGMEVVRATQGGLPEHGMLSA